MEYWALWVVCGLIIIVAIWSATLKVIDDSKPKEHIPYDPWEPRFWELDLQRKLADSMRGGS